MHTHLSTEGLSQEDLMDMLFLRLDAIIALCVNNDGNPIQWQSAHLLPNNKEPYSLNDIQTWTNTKINFANTAQALEDELARQGDINHLSTDQARCILISVANLPHSIQEENLIELSDLAKTAGLQVSGQMIQRISKNNYTNLLGKGKIAELEILALQQQANILVFDGELSPAQLHNIADITERKVIDRTQLILDIFAQHATTKAGKLQVEMAQLRYTQPRLIGKNKAMDRLMGGIGGRGPGETKLETDRRKCRERITKIKKDLENLSKQRSHVRIRRSRQGIPLVALVGYTNAGKSSLLNALTKSNVLTEDKLFATLDPTTRRIRFPYEQELIIADTVGFIRNLPKELMEAFHATLEELSAADLLVHVIDASHPNFYQQISSVETILEEIKLHQINKILVFNKWDKLNDTEKAALHSAFPNAIPLSALHNIGLSTLSNKLQSILLNN